MQVSHDDALAAAQVLHLTGRSTNFEHYPPHKVAHTLRSLTWCRNQSEQIGSGATKIIEEVSSASATHGLRASKRPSDSATDDNARLEAACTRALDDVHYRTIKGLLVAGTEHGVRPDDQSMAPPCRLPG